MTSRALKTQSSMNERPILMSAPMVRAILDGRKTQTRRIVKANLHPEVERVRLETVGGKLGFMGRVPGDTSLYFTPSPYGQPGDRLWVRETWGVFGGMSVCPDDFPNIYDHHDRCFRRVIHLAGRENNAWGLYGPPKWKPSIHMPRTGCRITLEIVSVRVERLQEISDEDAKAEGVTVKMDAVIAASMTDGKETPARMEFWDLWRSINGPDSWDKNPWVWAISFKRIEP